MIGAKVEQARCASYELEIGIDASPERVWAALLDRTNAWWLSDFHLAGPGSVVTFDAQAGGHLIERHPDGGSLLWYTVQWIQPAQHVVYLFGHMSPDFGGPSTTQLKIAVEADAAGGSVLRVMDAHVGSLSDEQLEQQRLGWTQLFTDGLKTFVERR